MKPKSDLDYFRKRVRHWQDRFGLRDWRIWVVWGLDDEESVGAVVSFDDEGDAATIRLNKMGRRLSRKELDRFAFHECHHLCVARLKLLAMSRFATKNEINREMEYVTLRVESAFFGTDVDGKDVG